MHGSLLLLAAPLQDPGWGTAARAGLAICMAQTDPLCPTQCLWWNLLQPCTTGSGSCHSEHQLSSRFVEPPKYWFWYCVELAIRHSPERCRIRHRGCWSPYSAKPAAQDWSVLAALCGSASLVLHQKPPPRPGRAQNCSHTACGSGTLPATTHQSPLIGKPPPPATKSCSGFGWGPRSLRGSGSLFNTL